MSRAQKVAVAPMLANIGAVNVPFEGWSVVDGMFPSIVVAHVDRLTACPKPPMGSYFNYYQPGAVVPILPFFHETRDLVISQVWWRLNAVGFYRVYAAVCSLALATAKGIFVPAGTPGPFARKYPLYVGGAPPQCAVGTTYAATRPDTWSGNPRDVNWTTLDNATSGTGQLRALDWLIPTGYCFLLYADSGFGIYGGACWHEQPPGAHCGSMKAFP